MMNKTKYSGVNYYESTERNIRTRGKTRRERCFYITYKAPTSPSDSKKKLFKEKVGWESEAISAETARDVRGQILANIRLGEGFQSLREKREIDQTQRDATRIEKEIEERENMPFDILATKYIEWAKDNKKSWKDDKSRYRYHVKPVIGHIPINNISILILEKLKKELKGKRVLKGSHKTTLSQTTVKHCLVLVRQIFNRSRQWGLFSGENPVRETINADKKFLKVADNKRLRFLTQDEAKNLLQEIQAISPQTHNICLLGLHTGMRMGEIFKLLWQDVDLTNELIHIRHSKNNESRQVFLTPPLLKMLKSILKKGFSKTDLVFKDRKGNKIHQLSDTFNRSVEKLGLNDGVRDAQNKVVPHTLRHTFASWLAQQGETLLTIKELMGHKDISMTMRYAHLIPDQKRKAVLKMASNS
jgi:integrase